jgi:hypothetical protein
MPPFTRSTARGYLHRLRSQGKQPLLLAPAKIREKIYEFIFFPTTLYIQSAREISYLLNEYLRAVTTNASFKLSIWASTSCGILFVSRQCSDEAFTVARRAMTYDITRSINERRDRTSQEGVLGFIAQFSVNSAQHIFGLDGIAFLYEPRETLFGLNTITTLRSVTISHPTITTPPKPSDEKVSDDEILGLLFNTDRPDMVYWLTTQTSFKTWFVGTVQVPRVAEANRQSRRTEYTYIVSLKGFSETGALTLAEPYIIDVKCQTIVRTIPDPHMTLENWEQHRSARQWLPHQLSQVYDSDYGEYDNESYGL